MVELEFCSAFVAKMQPINNSKIVDSRLMTRDYSSDHSEPVHPLSMSQKFHFFHSFYSRLRSRDCIEGRTQMQSSFLYHYITNIGET